MCCGYDVRGDLGRVSYFDTNARVQNFMQIPDGYATIKKSKSIRSRRKEFV